MDALRNENSKLQKHIEGYLQEIDKQKELNSQHETEIETLLKFNERLLGIIENELNNAKKDNVSLQPISQRSERESDMMGNTGQSFIKQRQIMAARSERNAPTRESLIDRAHISGNRLNLFEKDTLKSDIDHSIEEESVQPKRPPAFIEIKKSMEKSNQVQNQMQKEIEDFKQYKQQNNKFYDAKIVQLKNLSEKVGQFHPLDHFTKITSKVQLSPETSNLVRKAMMKNMI